MKSCGRQQTQVSVKTRTFRTSVNWSGRACHVLGPSTHWHTRRGLQPRQPQQARCFGRQRSSRMECARDQERLVWGIHLAAAASQLHAQKLSLLRHVRNPSDLVILHDFPAQAMPMPRNVHLWMRRGGARASMRCLLPPLRNTCRQHEVELSELGSPQPLAGLAGRPQRGRINEVE